MSNLDEAFRALREHDSKLKASPAVQARVLAEFSHQAGMRRWQRVRAWIPVAAAVLVAMCGAGWYSMSRPVAVLESAELRPGVPSAPAMAMVKARRAAITHEAKRPVPVVARNMKPKPLERPAVTRAAQRPREAWTDFIPLTAGAVLKDYESAGVVRVRLPGAALREFGFPMTGERMEPVQADVVVGQDGSARAIRFVRTY